MLLFAQQFRIWTGIKRGMLYFGQDSKKWRTVVRLAEFIREFVLQQQLKVQIPPGNGPADAEIPRKLAARGGFHICCYRCLICYPYQIRH